MMHLRVDGKDRIVRIDGILALSLWERRPAACSDQHGPPRPPWRWRAA